MCGIAGFLTFDNHEILPPANRHHFIDPLKFRGPDDRGDWHYQSDSINVSLFHARLSIIDLNPTGHQPMLSADEQVAIVFNGEIYNYKELQHELIKSGFTFKSTSDTEVLILGYMHWGVKKLLEKIDGMFALALFDKKERKLFLARDRFGKKPLYYYVNNGTLIFSSDIRSFKAINSISFSVNFHALGYFFAEYGTPEEDTVWNEIRKLKPASYLQFNNSGISAYENYWNLTYSESCSLNELEIIEKVNSLISQAVKKRLVADVRVSAMLSGGIDSSMVVAKMAEHLSGRVKTYSVGFNEKDFNELPFARQVANKFDTDHTELIIDSHNLEGIDKLILEFGEPFADSSMIPTYLMSKEISKSEKVVLGGDGGDELFGGYDSYYFALKFDQVKKWAPFYPVSRFLAKGFPSYRTEFLERLLRQTQRPDYTLLNRNFSFDSGELKKLVNKEIFYNAVNDEHERAWKEYAHSSRHQLINVMSVSLRTRLLNDYLVKVDRASMYASLEMRSPFLDKDLVEFAATLRPHQIFKNAEPKSLLKKIASSHFSESFVYRKKMGFGIPIGKWFQGDLIKQLKEVVLGGKQKMIDLNYQYIETLINDHSEGKANRTEELWSLYVFHIWVRNQ
jgi:asparagine synthase (glutamine-hydrolysing)